MCFVGERRATARFAPTQKSRSAYKRVVEDADPYAENKKCGGRADVGIDPYEKTRAALGVGVLMLSGPLHESGDQQENEARGLEDKAQDGGVDEQKGGADDDKA